MRPKLFLATLLLGACLAAPARAQNEPMSISKWFLPDSPFYMLQRMNEKINLWLTFGEKEEAERHWMMAERRFGEYAALAGKGKASLAARAAEEYGAQMARAREGFARLKMGAEGQAWSAAVEASLRAKAERMKSDLGRAPQEAKDALERVLAGIQDFLGESPRKE